MHPDLGSVVLASKHINAAQGWQPIFAHPLFAIIVPMWFAATFALSTLAVRGALIEQLVLSSQIELLLPMATPPLGMTARLLLAAAFGVGGGLLGWLTIRLIAPGTARRPARRPARRSVADPRPATSDHPLIRLREADAHPDAPARRPIWAHEELGAQSFDSPVSARALPVRHDHDEPKPPVETAPAPLPDSAPVPIMAPEPAAPKPMALSPGFPIAPVDGPSAADHIARAPLESLSHIELIERLAIVMQRHHAATGATDSAGSGTADALRAALAGLREVK